MKRTPLLVIVSLLLTVCIASVSYLCIYYDSYELEYGELDFESYDFDNGILTVRVRSAADGEYLYKVLAGSNENAGEWELTFRGGKQKALAQNPESVIAKFSIEIPAGTNRVVCGENTVYRIERE